MQPVVTRRNRTPAVPAPSASGSTGPGGSIGVGGGGGGGGGSGPGGGGGGSGGGGHSSCVLMVLLSVTVSPPAVPEIVAVFGTTEGWQSAGALVFFEHEKVQMSPGSSVRGVLSAPDPSDLPTSSGASSQFGSVTRTDAAGNGRSPGFVTSSV